MEYLDFELRISSGSGRTYPVTVVRSPAGESHGTMQFPFDKLALDNQLLGLQNALLRSGSLRRQAVADPEETRGVIDFGKQLFQALFTPEVQVAYRRSRDRAAAEDKGLRLRLRIDAPELSSLPWEFMYDATERDYVCLSTDTPLVRYLEFDQPPAPLRITPPLSLLVMIASPSDRPALDVARERERIEHATRRLRSEGFMRIEWLQGSSWRDLQQALRRNKHHIFHFVGHGGFDSVAGEGALMLTDEDGRASMISATAIARLLSDHRTLRLAILNSCLGAKGSTTDVLSSTAAILVGRGLPAVVAMQFEISDDAAIEFSRSLYDAIAEGMPIDAAVAEARKAMITQATHSVEWGTPVLHMRSPDGVLFKLDGTKPSEARATGNFPKPTWTPTEGIDAAPPAGGVPGAASTGAAAPAASVAPAASPGSGPMPATPTPVPPVAPPDKRPTTTAAPPAMRLAESAAATSREHASRADGGASDRPPVPPTPAGSRGMLYGIVGAVAVAAAVAAYVMRPKPEARVVPTADVAVVSDVRLTATDTIVMMNGAPMSADYVLLGRDGDAPLPGADSLLRAAGDRVVVLSSDPTVVQPDSNHQAEGRFYLVGTGPGVAQIYPVLLRANGDSVGSKRRTVVRVDESSENRKRAYEAFHAVDSATRDSSVSDSALLQRVARLDSTHGRNLRDSSLGPDLLTPMFSGVRDLIATRQRADSIVADTNATMQARYAALQEYLARVTDVRGGRGPTVAADSARLVTLDPRPVGTVSRGAICTGSRLCGDADGLPTEVAVNQRISTTIWFVRGSSASLRFEWRREGDSAIDRGISLSAQASGRIFDPHTPSAPGRWEVRVLNGAKQLVFRHTFDVR